MALAMSGFIIGMAEHDRAAGLQAIEAALALSPSTAIAHMAGSDIFGWAGQAERAIEWAERALRLSPLDPTQWYSCRALTLAHFALGHDEEALAAARRGIQYNPEMSISCMLLAAPLSRLGRVDEAKAAAARLMELQPNFSIAATGSAAMTASGSKRFWKIIVAPDTSAGCSKEPAGVEDRQRVDEPVAGGKAPAIHEGQRAVVGPPRGLRTRTAGVRLLVFQRDASLRNRSLGQESGVARPNAQLVLE